LFCCCSTNIETVESITFASQKLKPNLELRIPRGSVRRLERPVPAIPEQRTQLKPLLAATNRVNRPFVAQVDVLADYQALGLLVRQDGRARGLGLAHDVSRAWFVQKAIVDAAGVPCVDPMRTPERFVADERMATPIVVSGIVVRAVVILLRTTISGKQ
jgi:hypothetical protein